jgi:EpsI family protein
MFEGPLHEATGIVVLLLSFILLFLGSLFFKWLFPNKKIKQSNKNHDNTERTISRPYTIWGKSIVFSLFLISVSFVPKYMISAHQVPEHKPLSSFPTHINNWQGNLQTLDQKILNNLWTDDYISATFKNMSTKNILYLLIPYYKYQTTQHTAHAPTSCLLGSGFSIKRKQVLEPKQQGERNFPVQQMVLQKNGQTILSNFWFDQRGRVITNEYLNKLYLFWDGLTRGRTDGALVRIEMTLKPSQSISQGQMLLETFLVELKHILDQYIPN